jgi:hypothetical protein
MKTTIGLLNRGLIVLAGLAVTTGAAFAGDLLIERFGMIGVTFSETARLNAVLQPGAHQECVVDMRFVDSQNRTLVAAQKVRLRPNIAEFIDLPGTNAYMWSGEHKTRPQVRAIITPMFPATGCKVSQTLEVFDTLSGKTSVVVQPVP